MKFLEKMKKNVKGAPPEKKWPKFGEFCDFPPPPRLKILGTPPPLCPCPPTENFLDEALSVALCDQVGTDQGHTITYEASHTSQNEKNSIYTKALRLASVLRQGQPSAK